MFRELLTGIAGGTLSGISPGIHVNTLAAFLSALGMSNNLLLFSMGLTHTFLDVVPSAFLGVPDEGTALGILPAHRLVLQGRAMEVVRMALWASFLAILMAFPLIPVYTVLASHYRADIGRAAVLLLFAVLVVTERGWRRVYAVFVFLLSGVLGVFVFRLPLTHPYYHLFTGLFGVPVLIGALFGGTGDISPGSGEVLMERGRFLKFSFLGTILGMAASLIPAFTASQAALMGSFISRDERSFLTVVFSVNTANFIFSFVNFVETGRRRNGIVSLMAPMSADALLVYLSAAVFVAAVILLYGEPLARLILSALTLVPYRLLNASVLLLLACLSFLFDGPAGLLILAGSAMIGLLPPVLGMKRTNCMGVLMLPIIIG
ncbi:hypothetical protein E3E36_05645 [Thermococcus sp. M36]|uniref:tripartite tricarboxylate transporter permease n=1 Tax=Thermococcus sp. M36 TaxID=1638261 RepID=UPI00143B099E|nr:tripartite tricarboxylate transporter permease [Thermococcus sp. M36]NJE05633.1 hypothetical protein [Thermococcus sp. M36]